MKPTLSFSTLVGFILGLSCLSTEAVRPASVLPPSPPYIYASAPTDMAAYGGIAILKDLTIFGWTPWSSSQSAGGTLLFPPDSPPTSTVGTSTWANNDPYTVGTFNTELTSMSMSFPVTSFGTLYLRESPVRASQGVTTVSNSGSGYVVESFFDIWTELSIDGGMTWIPSDQSVRVTLVPEAGSASMLILGLSALVLRRIQKR